jgi:hypothetical protein
MSDEKIQRVSCLAEQILEMCDEEDVSVLDKVDALTVVMSHMLSRLKDNARRGVADGVLKMLKTELKK